MSEETTSPDLHIEKENLVKTDGDTYNPRATSAVGILAIIGSLASLISIPLAIYFYFQAKDYPQLTFYENSVKAVVVKAGQASRLTTSYDNREIKTDITAAQVALWNAGTKSIKSTEILNPIVINTDKGTPILEATIRKVSREVTRLALNTDEIQKGRVVVSWNILEQNDGGVIQIIYEGDPNVKVNIDGVIEGQPQIVRREGTPSPPDILMPSILLAAGVLMTVLLLIIFLLRFKNKSPIIGDYDDWFMIGTAVTLFVFGFYNLYVSRGHGPPFGF